MKRLLVFLLSLFILTCAIVTASSIAESEAEIVEQWSEMWCSFKHGLVQMKRDNSQVEITCTFMGHEYDEESIILSAVILYCEKHEISYSGNLYESNLHRSNMK